MSKLNYYLEEIKKPGVNNLKKFGFAINVTNEKTGELEKFFVSGDTIDEFMKNLLNVVPDLAEESQKKIRENLKNVEKEVMN